MTDKNEIIADIIFTGIAHGDDVHQGWLREQSYRIADEVIAAIATKPEFGDNGNTAAIAAQDWINGNGGVITISEAADLVNSILPHLSPIKPVSLATGIEAMKIYIQPDVPAILDGYEEAATACAKAWGLTVQELSE